LDDSFGKGYESININDLIIYRSERNMECAVGITGLQKTLKFIFRATGDTG
jgi:hypothetical protein